MGTIETTTSDRSRGGPPRAPGRRGRVGAGRAGRVRDGPPAPSPGALLRLPDHDVDVVLCDPVGRAVDLENYLVGVVAETPARVLAFIWASDLTTARRALAAGAHGWLSKASSSVDLVAAVEAVHRGEVVAGTECLQDELDLRSGSSALIAREREVLSLICRGLSNQEIAADLFVSVNSVKTYIRQIYQKIGVSRRAQAVAWGIARHF